eukprot:g5734.t1
MTGSFFCQIGMKAVWNDPRMINFPEDWDLPDDLWVPNVMMPNAMDIAEDSLYEGMASVALTDRKTGLLQWHRNVLAHFNCSFDLRRFPFDENMLAVRFNGSKLRDGRITNAKELVIHAGIPSALIQGPKKDGPFLLWSDRLAELLHEYELVGVAFSEFEKSNCSFISWGICIRRHTYYYYIKLIKINIWAE